MFCIRQEIYHIKKYLKGTKDKGIIFELEINKGLDCYIHANFVYG